MTSEKTSTNEASTSIAEVPTPPPRYRIEGDCLEVLSARLVYLMKIAYANDEIVPSLSTATSDVFRCTIADGSRVRVTLSRKPADENARDGIEIDGVKLALPEGS